MLSPLIVLCSIAVACVAAVVAAAIVALAAAMVVVVEQTDSVGYSAAAAVVATVDVDTEVVARFEESQKLCLFGPSC